MEIPFNGDMTETVAALSERLVGRTVCFPGVEGFEDARVILVEDANYYDGIYSNGLLIEVDTPHLGRVRNYGCLKNVYEDRLEFFPRDGFDIDDTQIIHLNPEREDQFYIRPIESNEIGKVLKLYAEEEDVIVDDHWLHHAKSAFNSLTLAQGAILGVFDYHGDVVGCLTVNLARDLYIGYAHGPYAHLETIIIDEGFQGKGLATSLVKYAIQYCRLRNVTYINCQTENPAMARVYEKAGLARKYTNYHLEFK
ncbi:GNAT family N-acetyltransferase [Paenibacillus pabuli]|uniref:GNAT family N-acetyltransferase n=1 Tax=Paenibacillus pabuli TaxID=1472 RepID=UPI003242ECB6